MIRSERSLKAMHKCPTFILLGIIIFSQNVRVFSGLAEGSWGTLRNIAELLILLFLAIRTLKIGRMPGNMGLYYIGYVFCMMISMAFHADTTGIFWILCFTMAFLLVANYDIRDLLQRFVRIMYFVCTIYLVGYGVLRMWPYLSMLPVYKMLVTIGVATDHSAMVPYYLAGVVEPRAYAFYREPGVYQMFVISALVLEFTLYEKINKKHLLVFILAVLSTYSKTGYICLILVLLGGAFIIWHKDKKLKQIFILGGVAVIPFLPIFLQVIIRAFIATGADSHSWMSRLASVFVNLYFYSKNPFIGVSVGKVFNDFAKVTKDIYGITAGIYDVTDDTNTVLLNFAAYGTLLGVMFIVGQWKCIKSLTNHRIARWLFFFALLFLYAGEAVNSTVFPYVICFIGISHESRRQLSGAMIEKEVASQTFYSSFSSRGDMAGKRIPPVEVTQL